MRRVRVCPFCGREFETSVVACPDDGTDLLGEPTLLRDAPDHDAVPVSMEGSGDAAGAPQIGFKSEAPLERLVLELVEDPSVRFFVTEGQTVGRTEKSDVVVGGVPNGRYISGQMARFSKRGDQWYVQHVATTNYIEVDGERYEDDTNVALHDGTVLSLALAPFVVRTGA